MSIDKQRIAAVRELEGLGYRWDGASWTRSTSVAQMSPDLVTVADTMARYLEARSVILAGCIVDTIEEDELEVIAPTLESYRRVRGHFGD